MKKTKQYLILLTLSVFFYSGLCFGQATHVITLNVAEDGSYSFSADPNTEVVDDSSPEAFTILVYEDDEIEWEGIAASGAVVDIEKIRFPEDHKVFKNKDLEGKNNNGKKKAKGKVAKGKKNKTYKYIIDFIVEGESFSIDPGLKVGQ
ncbi:hypothetical protein [Maribacter halichondriae]|uniref:hypothetical protein n=1 Tax=Maribacter halichondriae TaxID=2980554 RepID=UPI002358B3BB|nr:hypothetical protein [Maribacter sp. Hal144]